MQKNLGQEQSFPSWAFSTIQKLRKAVGIGAILAAAVSLKDVASDILASQTLPDLTNTIANHPQARINLAYVQATACFLLALLTPKPSLSRLKRRKNVDSSEFSTATRACNRIHLYVVATFLAWSLYYLVTGLSLRKQSPSGAVELLNRAVFVSLNTLPSLLLFWLYIELAEFTVDAPNPGKTRRRRVIFIEATSNAIAAFHRILSLGVFLLIIVPVWYTYGSSQVGTLKILEIISSCLNGVALALVVGRLGSKYIDPGSLTLGLLYLYAVIQPTAVAFPSEVTAHLVATTLALPLKILLWLVLVWAFTTGILSEYVHSIRVLLIHEHEVNEEALPPDEQIELETNTRGKQAIEPVNSSPKQPKSFVRTARSLKLKGQPDWSERLDEYLYGKRDDD